MLLRGLHHCQRTLKARNQIEKQTKRQENCMYQLTCNQLSCSFIFWYHFELFCKYQIEFNDKQWGLQ